MLPMERVDHIVKERKKEKESFHLQVMFKNKKHAHAHYKPIHSITVSAEITAYIAVNIHHYWFYIPVPI